MLIRFRSGTNPFIHPASVDALERIRVVAALPIFLHPGGPSKPVPLLRPQESRSRSALGAMHQTRQPAA